MGAGEVAPGRIATLAAIGVIRAAIGARWTIERVMAATGWSDEHSHFNEHTESDDSDQPRKTRKASNPTTSICHAAKIRQARFGNKPAAGAACPFHGAFGTILAPKSMPGATRLSIFGSRWGFFLGVPARKRRDAPLRGDGGL